MYMLFFFLFWQASEKRTVKVQADDPISFAQLVNKAEMGATEVQNSNTKDTKKGGIKFQGLKLTKKKLKHSFLFASLSVKIFYFSEHVWADIVSSFRNVWQERRWSYWGL